MSATFFSPIIHLSFISGLCPCFEKEEDRNARHALKALQKQRILNMRTSSSKSSIGNPMATLTSLFKNASNANSNDMEADQVAARLLFRDNDNSDPELAVVNQNNKTLCSVALGRIDRVILEPSGQVVLLGKPPIVRHGKQEGPAKEELRFIFIQEGGGGNTASNGEYHDDQDDDAPRTPSQEAAASPPLSSSTPSYIPVTNDIRNNLIHHLQVLMEWERQRRIDLSLDSLEDEPHFLRKQAQTAARFAERELELRETTRARAERKAKLVQQAGGLKYTALAMANRTSDIS
ncbi:hypothetical protein MPSEU_000772300 [Mayamaea pseudoterrestris]|nr:hypothetical protein MPSEU_000772300 [Mayamaea pseudoterrestris]